MKTKVLSLLILLSALNFAFSEKEIEVTPDFTQKQIEQVEGQALKRFGKKYEVKVLKRNAKGEIEHLICIRYSASGNREGSCGSDDFGYLVIRVDGCEIADKGVQRPGRVR